MVGPVPDDERSSFARRVKAAIVVFVGLSAGLITLQGDVPLWVSGAAVVAGLITGVVLVYIVFPGDSVSRSNRGRR